MGAAPYVVLLLISRAAISPGALTELVEDREVFMKPCIENFTGECGWGIAGAIVTGLVLFTLQTCLFVVARRTNPAVRFFDLIVTGEDARYSLSRFQIYLWTLIALVAFGASTFANGKFADIPTNLWLLMGLNVATAVTATAITPPPKGAPTQAAAPPAQPAQPQQAVAAPAQAPAVPPQPQQVQSQAFGFVGDLFYESGRPGSLDLPRTQMFVWTIVVAAAYIVLFVKQFPCPQLPCAAGSAAPSLLDVPIGLVALMGVSQGAYIGSKATGR
jgi:hypothetical protein